MEIYVSFYGSLRFKLFIDPYDIVKSRISRNNYVFSLKRNFINLFVMISFFQQSYIFEDDLYYQLDPYAVPTRLTTTGEEQGVRNGMSFWNYGGKMLLSSVLCLAIFVIRVCKLNQGIYLFLRISGFHSVTI